MQRVSQLIQKSLAMFFGALPAIEIFPCSRFYCNSHWNFLPNTPGNNKLAGGPPEALTKSSGSLASISCILTPTPGFVHPFTNNELFKWFMQAYLEDYGAFSTSVERKNIAGRSLQTQNLDLYYGNSYMGCQYSCRQCENHFDIAEAKRNQYILFAAFFLKDCIFYCWQ